MFGLKGKTILDLGCGTGKFSLPLSGKAVKIYCLDKSRPMLSILRKKARRNKITSIDIINTDFSHVSLPEETVDMVFSCWSFPAHSANWDKDFTGIKKTLKKGGIFIALDTAPSGQYWNIRKEVLGEEYRESNVYRVHKWYKKKGFRRKNTETILDFRSKKGVRKLCRPFYGGGIAGYMIAKGMTRLRFGMSLFYRRKK